MKHLTIGTVLIIMLVLISEGTHGRELNGKFIWGDRFSGQRGEKAEFPCAKYLEIEAPLDEEESRRFEKLVEISLTKSEGHFIQSLFRDIAKSRDYTRSFPKHPLYPVFLKKLLSHALNEPLLELPYNIDVQKAYEYYIAHQRDLVLLGMYYQKAAVCQAVGDAAGYFMDRTAFGLVELFDNYIDYFKCDNSYSSWHQKKRKNGE